MTNTNRKIKILFVQEPAGGGSLIALYEMLKVLDPEVIEPVVLCYYKSKYTQQLEAIKGCKVIYAEDSVELNGKRPSKFSNNRLLNILLIQYNALKKYFILDKELVKYFNDVFSQEKPDILHHNNDIVVNRSSIRAGAKGRIPQVLYNHGLPFYRFHLVEYIIDFILLKKIRYHIHLTEAIYDHYIKLFHTSLRSSVIIHSFIDRNIFKPMLPVDSIKKEFGIEDNEIIIADIGRITYWKGQHVLIEALNIIKNELPKFKVLMVGSDEKGVGSKDYYNDLQKLACTYQLQDKIIFTGNRTDIAEIMNTSDLVVHTAVKPEPQGIVILEALLCKKTVIASDEAGSAELIKKYGGILFQPGNAQQLAEILLKLFSKNQGRSIETRYPYKYEQLNSDFNSSVKAKQILDIYKECVRS
jgi:glycosyltransferase involved in cell wall biosynthesis